MKILKKLSIYSLSLLLVFTIACDTEEDLIDDRKAENPLATGEEPLTGSSGNADFSNYIAIGNSTTAGFMDGALYSDGQANAFPALIGAQLRVPGIDGGEFNQPDINSENGFNSTFSDLSASPPVIAGKTVLDTSIPGPVPTFPGELPTPFTGDKSQLNNFGVPGIQLAQLLIPQTGGPAEMNPAYNGLYARFATNPGVSTILGDAIATNPTFFSLWIGSNDVLGYAITGGNGTVPLTNAGSFQTNYGMVLQQLVGTGAKGVVVNIPPVLLIPYFRAISTEPIPMDEATATATNQAYASYNAGLAAALNAGIIDQAEHDLRRIEFSAGNNGFVTDDPELTDVNTLSGGMIPIPKLRQTNASDLIPLSAGALLGELANPEDPTSVYGVGVSLGDTYVLTLAEQTEIITARATFNGIIDGVVAATNATAGAEVVAVHDVQPLFADLAGLSSAQAAQLALSEAAQGAADGELGIRVNGFNYSPDFSPNGVFSTDGVHPNPKGHAIFANELIETINQSFGSDIPKIDIIPFRTVITAQ